MNTRTKTILYWVSTLWLCLGMVSTGIVQLLHQEAKGAISPPGTEGMAHLGFPMYMLTILGIWKLLGAAAVLLPRTALLKEWAYAGFFFCMSGALAAHAFVGDAFVEFLPSLLLLLLCLVSWWLRPQTKRLVAVAVAHDSGSTLTFENKH